jgi:predicted Rossmann fold nucleotide-binding protein DprA/Smf involved in DNA uptake
MLLRDGAAAISSADDVLRALEFDIDGPSDFKNIAELALSPEEKRIIAVLQISPMSSSDLMETTSLGTSAFSILASQLELKGVIIEEGGLFRMKR